MVMFKSYPLPAFDFQQINSPFGMRIHPVYKKPKLHEGIDYKAPIGTPVLAVADGTVLLSKMQSGGGGYGNYIVINHGKFVTLYAHLSKRIKQERQSVRAGETVGLVGTTGSSTGPHLHFGLCSSFAKRDWSDPMEYLNNIKGDDEVVDTTKIIINGKVVEVERILKNNTNYIKLRDFDDKLNLCKVGYDSAKQLPVITVI